MGRMEEAEASYRRAVEMMETLCDELPAFHSYREEFVDRIRDLIRFRPDLRTTETLVTRHPRDIRLHELHAEQLAKSRQPLAALTTAIERFPGQSAYYSYRAEILEALGRQEETRLDLNEAISLLSTDGDAQAYVTRGELFTRAGQFDRAMDDFREAFTLSIDDYELADSVAQVSRRLTGKGQFEQGLAIARLVLEAAAPPHWQAHVAVCEAQLGLQRYDEAFDQIAIAIEKAPRQWWLYKRRAEASLKLTQFEEALADLTTALEHDPSDMSIITWIAPERVAACPSPEFRAGMRRLADRAVDLNNESIEPLVARARLAVGFGDWNQAKRDLEAALEQKPDSGRATNELAWFLVTAREPSLLDPQRAVALATEAVELKPENATYRNTLGVAQYRAGDYAAAVESLTRAAQLPRGTNAYNYLFLAMSHWQLGNQEQARPWYDKSVQWISDRDVANEELLRFQKEAESLLGVAPAEPNPDASQ
jgi:tetratricopeptide (TPR) repeat protein